MADGDRIREALRLFLPLATVFRGNGFRYREAVEELDALLARLHDAERERDYWREHATAEAETGAAAEGRVRQLEAALRDKRAEMLRLRAECREEGSHAEAAMYGHKADAYGDALAAVSQEAEAIKRLWEDLSTQENARSESWERRCRQVEAELAEVRAATAPVVDAYGRRWAKDGLYYAAAEVLPALAAVSQEGDT